MQYGHFDDDAREYVITNPDTPQPWINYLGSLDYGAIISNNAQGYSFVKSGYSCRLLRWRFNMPLASAPGRFVYVRDRDSGDFWSCTWLPVCKPLNAYRSECRHGTGYTIIRSAWGGIETTAAYYVPRGAMHEVWALTVRNTGGAPRRLSLFPYAELTNHNHAGQDNDNLQYSQYISRTYFKGDFLLQVINENQSEVGRVTGIPGPAVCRFVGVAGAPVCGCDGSREAFVGVNAGYHCPAAVVRGQCSGSLNYTKNSAGAFQIDMELGAGESRSLAVVLGLGGEETARAVLARYADPGTAAAREIEEIRSYWHELLGRFSVETPDPLFNTMVNTWNAYQCFITFSLARAASLVYTGERNGFGYRDAVQDIAGIMHLDPDSAGRRLRLMLSGQLSTGGALPLVRFDFQPGRLNPGEATPQYRCDDALWLFGVVDMYIRETGLLSLMDEPIPYADTGSATVFEHLRSALRFSLDRRGEHGLVLGLSADWNDCIRLGETGETTFASFQLYQALVIFAGYAAALGRVEDESWARTEAQALLGCLQRHAWEGDRFVRAFSAADRHVVGSKKNEEGTVFLNPQSWAVVSGAVSGEQARRAMDTVYENLSTPYGVMLCYPAFRRYGLPVMRAVLFLPGVKENAGIFCHPQGWAILAEAMLGRGGRAWEYYNNCNPARMNDHAEIREIEPYVHCQFTEGRESPFHGRSQNPWLTGTAATVQAAALHGILGIRPERDGLRIDPSIPPSWDSFRARRLFRGKEVRIRVLNPDHVEHGVVSVTVNGRRFDGAVAPLSAMGDVTEVEVLMGAQG